MGRVAASLELPIPLETVFRVATRIDDLPKWLPEVAGAELLDPTLAPGSRVRLRMGPGAGGVEVLGTVRDIRAPSLLVIAGAAGPLSLEVRTRLEANGPGASRVSLEITIGTPPMLGFIGREAERRISAELPGALQRFRALAEAEPA